MEFNFAEKVNILGQDYTIEVVKRGEHPAFKGEYIGAFGFTDYMTKQIVLRDRSEDSVWKEYEKSVILEYTKKTLRHEIIHAFLMESGLHNNTKVSGPWAKNEEMVDWFALQGPKIIKAWTESGAL